MEGIVSVYDLEQLRFVEAAKQAFIASLDLESSVSCFSFLLVSFLNFE